MDSEADYIPDESEQLDQMDAERTLENRRVEDPLDEGYIAPDHWSAAEGFGNTAEEMRRGETLEQRIRQEEPERPLNFDTWKDDPFESREVGGRRAGRLVDGNHGWQGLDDEGQEIGLEVGIDGGAASAEEAAMHIIDGEEEELED